jgi:hypothetical protein
MKIEYVSDVPAFYLNVGKWRELYETAERMTVGQVIRVEVNNQVEARSAQASLQGAHGKKDTDAVKETLRGRGYRFLTRTRPVGSKEGKWYLYVKRVQ